MFHYVYILVSERDPTRDYVGLTENLHDRLARHNSPQPAHIAARPLAHRDRDRVRLAREGTGRYLKFHSGRAFSIKHF